MFLSALYSLRRAAIFCSTLLLVSPLAIASPASPYERADSKGDGQEGVEVLLLEKVTQSWDGTSLPSVTLKETEITVNKIRLLPGARLPWHKHPVVNIGYVTQGTLTVVKKNGHCKKLEVGDALVETVAQWHYGQNAGSVPVELILIFVGEKGQKLTILESKQTEQDAGELPQSCL